MPAPADAEAPPRRRWWLTADQWTVVWAVTKGLAKIVAGWVVAELLRRR